MPLSAFYILILLIEIIIPIICHGEEAGEGEGGCDGSSRRKIGRRYVGCVEVHMESMCLCDCCCISVHFCGKKSIQYCMSLRMHPQDVSSCSVCQDVIPALT